MSHAREQIEALGGIVGTYTPHLGQAKRICGLIDPVRRTDTLGNQSFLSKTYELWLVKSATEGVTSVKANYDTFAVKLHPDDEEETTLRITKIYPEWDHGTPGDGIGMWHLEAVV